MNAMVDARVSLVMAGTQGLGRGCAEALLSSGFRVAICARHQDGVDSALRELRETGGEVVGRAADVSRPDELASVFELVDEAFGRLDVLVVNAGGPKPGAFLSLGDDDWRAGFELTLMSAVTAIRTAIPRMRSNGYGRIVVLGSSSARMPIPNLALSNAFRPALDGVVKTLAAELAPEGVTVNMVCPGRIDTSRVRDLDESRARREGLTPEEVRVNSERSIPIGHYGAPRDVGGLTAFLASEQAGYITGQCILVDGGMVLALP
jgi:3-oxoacyl-[acyl-carrier protein] reductase